MHYVKLQKGVQFCNFLPALQIVFYQTNTKDFVKNEKSLLVIYYYGTNTTTNNEFRFNRRN
jgi:hypothetical protein